MENDPEFRKLMDQYKKHGIIGRIKPKGYDHARSLAKTFAKKIHEERKHGK